MAAGLVLASWGLSLRLEREAAAVARDCERAGAVEAAALRLHDGMAHAEAAAVRGGGAGGDYWRAEADATRQVDALGTLALQPGMAWLAAPAGALREAALSRMAALDAALRGQALAPEDGTGPLVQALVGQAEERRRDLVARALAATSLDRGWLVAVVAMGAALLAALGWRRPDMPVGVAQERKAPSVPDPVPSTGLRVLLVEDNAMVRFSMEAMLSDLGHSVTSAGDAAEAVELAATGQDVLVTDFGLPDMDGVALARKLRAERPSLRVVVASGRPGAEPGMVWLCKPFDLERLRRAVEESADCN